MALTISADGVVRDGDRIIVRPVEPVHPVSADRPDEPCVALQDVPGEIVAASHDPVTHGLVVVAADGLDGPIATLARQVLHSALTAPRPGIRIIDHWTYTFILYHDMLWLTGVRHNPSGDEVVPEQWKRIAAALGVSCVALATHVVDLAALVRQGYGTLRYQSGLRVALT